MKIHNVQGCTANSLNVDGKEEIDMIDVERIAVIDRLHIWMKEHPYCLNYILQDLTEQYGEYHVISDKPCECCGDTIIEHVLEI